MCESVCVCGGGGGRQAGSLNANPLNGRPSFCAYAIKQPEKEECWKGDKRNL